MIYFRRILDRVREIASAVQELFFVRKELFDRKRKTFHRRLDRRHDLRTHEKHRTRFRRPGLVDRRLHRTMSNDVSRLRRRSRGMSKRQTNVEKYEHAISCSL